MAEILTREEFKEALLALVNGYAWASLTIPLHDDALRARVAELEHERDEHRGVGIACEARAEKAEAKLAVALRALRMACETEGGWSEGDIEGPDFYLDAARKEPTKP